MNIDTAEAMECFLDFSTVATGFSKFELQGTGQAELYFDTIRGVIGGEIFAELLQAFRDSGDTLDDILESAKLGPIAANVIKLWYVATWDSLPDKWNETFGKCLNDNTFIASPYAYTEGLLWTAIGVNPPAAKAPGYGSWKEAPSIPAMTLTDAEVEKIIEELPFEEPPSKLSEEQIKALIKASLQDASV